MSRTRARLHELYHGRSREAVRFQAAWLVFDVLLIGFFAVSPFLERGSAYLAFDYAIALVLAIDLAAQAWSFRSLSAWLKRPIVWVDLIVLVSLIVPTYAANLGFLRILRAYSLVHGKAFWRVIADGKWADTQRAETVKAITNLFVFIFMMAALVHTAFAARVPELASYMDSLYFTVTALTTTGFGDVVLPGFWGRGLSIIIMIGGVSLFFRLIQVAMRTGKVVHSCPACGLMRHEPDAVHCKACGIILRIEHDNE
ncbi:MAG: potassium channel family protein [Terricaulis sp.]